MTDLFKEIIPSLMQTKKYCLEDEKDYNSFVINKSISQHDDGIFYASQMNRMSTLSKKAQYDFYFHALKAKRRPFTKWVKHTTEDDIELIKQYFGYNDNKARDVINIITEEQLKMMKETLMVE